MTYAVTENVVDLMTRFHHSLGPTEILCRYCSRWSNTGRYMPLSSWQSVIIIIIDLEKTVRNVDFNKFLKCDCN